MFATDSEPGLDQTIVQAMTVGLEATINTALRYDPASRKKIAALNEILAIELTIPSLCFYLQGQEEGVAILSYCEAPVTTHLTGSPLALFNLLKQPSSLASSDVSLVGSTGLLQQWQAILQTLDIDWEDAISQILGDVGGPLAASTIKKNAQWMGKQCTEHGRLLSEYLPEELKVTPSKPEAEAFFEQIDELKFSVDRLSARMQKLHAQFSTPNDNEKSS